MIGVLLFLATTHVMGVASTYHLGSAKAPRNFLKPTMIADKTPPSIGEELYEIELGNMTEGVAYEVDIELTGSHYRLPTSLRPVHYVVYLQPMISDNGTDPINGQIYIEIEVMESTSDITLNVDEIDLKTETMEVVPADDPLTKIGIIDTVVDSNYSTAVISLEQSLEVGKIYIFTTDFLAYLKEDYFGFYKMFYLDQGRNEVYFAMSQFHGNRARRAFPCFDEPSFKATFEIYIGYTDPMNAIANMPLLETIPIEGQEGWFWNHFETTLETSTYTLAFVVSDFVSMSTTSSSGIPYTVWSRSLVTEHLQYTYDKGPDVLDFFGSYFEIPYVMPKMDILVSSDYGAYFDYWGLIIEHQDTILFNPDVDGEIEKQWVMKRIATESVSQWIGNLVTHAWWSQLWVSVGFANYFQYMGANYSEPSWHIIDRMVVEEMHFAFVYDCYTFNVQPVVSECVTTSDIDSMFDVFSYEKGASLVRMLQYMLTEPTFLKGFKNYLNEYKYSNTVQDDIFEHLTTVGHEDGTLPAEMTIKEIMKTWTYQEGIPLLTVNRTGDGTSAHISQTRFWYVSVPAEERWMMPITYTSQSESDWESTQPKLWMQDYEVEIVIGGLPRLDEWVIFNIQQAWYCRVNYDDNNWDLLLYQLDYDPYAIHPINRAQIINDYGALNEYGLQPYEKGLQMMLYLKKEREFIPWTAALNSLDYLHNMLQRTEANNAFRNYLLDILLPLYKSFGFHGNPDATQEDIFLHMLAVAWVCDLGYKDCVDKSVYLYKEWMQEPSNHRLISPNMRKTVYCTAIAAGTEKEWNFALSQYLLTKSNTEKYRLLEAMACTRDPSLLNRYLEQAFSTRSFVSENVIKSVFTWIAKSNPTGRDVAWDFLRNNAQHMDDLLQMTAVPLGELIIAVSENFNTEDMIAQLRSFDEEFYGFLDDSSTMLVSQALARGTKNVDWLNWNYDVIKTWLYQQGYNN